MLAEAFTLVERIEINRICHEIGVAFLMMDIYGPFAGMFCDFGANHKVIDPDGNEPFTAVITNITQV